jgi:hypothetical protein
MVLDQFWGEMIILQVTCVNLADIYFNVFQAGWVLYADTQHVVFQPRLSAIWTCSCITATLLQLGHY